MSFKEMFVGRILRSLGSHYQLPSEGGRDVVKADLTSQYTDRNELIQDIKQQKVVQIKIYIKDLAILISHIEYLVNSLVDLRIRPQVVRNDDDTGEGTPDRRSPEGFEMLLFQSEKFVNYLSKLVNLEHLSLDNDGAFAEGLLQSISNMTKLNNLTFQNCSIPRIDVQLPTSLKHVDLSSNSLFAFPEALLWLEQLDILILCRNYISNLPDDMKGLHQLKKLDLSYNELTCIPDSIFQLKKLIKLYLTENKIKELPKNIGKFSTLKHLELRGNQINTLPDSIGDLHQLIKLNLCNNQLTALPETICNLEIDDDALLFSGNPLQLPPTEVCMQGSNAMKGFFDALNRSTGVKCKRLKLVLVGESFAGKTSLAHAMVNKRDANIKPDQRTVGLDFYKWRPNPLQENDLEILVIDCAGQRKYLLTHQFFFTEGALFVLVMDLSAYNMTDYDYRIMIGDWISLIISHIPGALIMIVPTHLDLCEDKDVELKCKDILLKMREEERRRLAFLESESKILNSEGLDIEKIKAIDFLRKSRPHLPSFLCPEELAENSTDIALIPVCCKGTLQGTNKLQREILQIASNPSLCHVVNKKIPQSWVDLENEMMKLKNQDNIPCIEFSPLFETTSEACSLTKEMFNSCLLYLNAVGSIAFFNYVKRASHLVFLNPEWLIRLLQLLFRHNHEEELLYNEEYLHKHGIFPEQFEQDKEEFLCQGRLSKRLLSCIWLEMLGQLDGNLLSQIVEILHHFGIICKIPSKETSDDTVYFIPWFVAEEQPESVTECWNENRDSEKKDNIIFKMTTSIARLPNSVLERLLVYVHEKTELCIPWKSGFLITQPNLKLLCNVSSGSSFSSIKLHGRCRRGFTKDTWRWILRIWKELQILIDEWIGIIMRNIHSLCPHCVERNRKDPYIFTIDFTRDCCSLQSISCRKCNEYLEPSLVLPPQDIIQEIFETNGASGSQDTLTAPLSDAELSKFATKIGTRHTELAVLLGLSQEQDVRVAQGNWPHSQYEQAMELLGKWKLATGKSDRIVLIWAVKQLNNLDPSILRFLEFGTE